MVDIIPESTHFTQTGESNCGHAVAVMALKISQLKYPTSDDFYAYIGIDPNRYGTPPDKLEKYLVEHGVNLTEYHYLSPKQAKRIGNPLITVFQSVRWGEYQDRKGNIKFDPKKLPMLKDRNNEFGHYILVTKIYGGKITYLDPGINYSIDGNPIGVVTIPENLFYKRWFDVDFKGKLYKNWALEVKPKSNYF